MKKTFVHPNKLIEKILCEQEWNKDSKTPRDYSKEYNAPGSKEQDERNKRKRDKRKHDKEFGECPDNQDLHHVDGIENYKVKCEPPYLNRGRKEKSRLKKGKIVLKIEEHQLKKIIQEETEKVLKEEMDDLAPLSPTKSPTVSDSALSMQRRKEPSEVMPIVHLGLDIAGFIPGVGAIADVTNVAMYIAEGKLLLAAFSAVAALPIIGSAIGAGAKYGGAAMAKVLGPKIIKNFGAITKLFQKLASNPKIAPYVAKMLNILKKYAIDGISGEAAEGYADLTGKALQKVGVMRPATKEQIKAIAVKAPLGRKGVARDKITRSEWERYNKRVGGVRTRASDAQAERMAGSGRRLGPADLSESSIDQLPTIDKTSQLEPVPEEEDEEEGSQKKAKKTIAKQTPTKSDDETVGDLLKKIIQEETLTVCAEYNIT